MYINGYQVLNSNASKQNRACVRVKLNSIILCELRSEHSNPLRYLRIRPQSEERKEFVRQLRENLVPEVDIQALLKLPDNA